MRWYLKSHRLVGWKFYNTLNQNLLYFWIKYRFFPEVLITCICPWNTVLLIIVHLRLVFYPTPSKIIIHSSFYFYRWPRISDTLLVCISWAILDPWNPYSTWIFDHLRNPHIFQWLPMRIFDWFFFHTNPHFRSTNKAKQSCQNSSKWQF